MTQRDPRIVSRRTFMTASAMIAGSAVVLGSQPARRAFALQDSATPEAGGGMPPLPEGATVVAQGLWNPTDITFGPDGTLYISESGVSGGGTPDETQATPDASGSPVPSAPMIIPGQVTSVGADGTVKVIAEGLGSVVGIAVSGETIYVSAGGGSVGSGFAPQPVENTVSAIDIATGTVTLLAELGPYEVANNPDGTDINPNLYGLAVDADGLIYVADAGGNTIYTVDPTAKTFSLFTVVPSGDELGGGTPSPEQRQPVPTSIVIDASGNIIVGLLSLGWQWPSILTYSPAGTYTASVNGLTTLVALAIGPDDQLYGTQLSDDFNEENPGPGSVKRITADGNIETVAEGLFFPHGLAFDAAGNLYVATNSIISGPDAALGIVIRLDGIATPA